MAALAIYSIWRHVPSEGVFPRMYLYVSAGLFLIMCIFQGYTVFRQNGIIRYKRAGALVTQEYGAIRVRIQLQKPVNIGVGQALNLWIWAPSVSFWSFLQSHPFVVISWSESPQRHLDLFIEPREGLTRNLLRRTKIEHAIDFPVLFSGPHGNSVPMDDCENILMVASDFGIAAHLPYIKRLIHGYNARKLRARRIHFVWQVRDIGKYETHHCNQTENLTKPDVTVAAQPLLNDALNEDTLDNGWVYNIVSLNYAAL